MGYAKLKDFDDLRTCSLDPYMKEQLLVIKNTFEALDDGKCDKDALESLKEIVDTNFQENTTQNSAVLNEIEIIKGSVQNFLSFSVSP